MRREDDVLWLWCYEVLCFQIEVMTLCIFIINASCYCANFFSFLQFACGLLTFPLIIPCREFCILSCSRQIKKMKIQGLIVRILPYLPRVLCIIFSPMFLNPFLTHQGCQVH